MWSMRNHTSIALFWPFEICLFLLLSSSFFFVVVVVIAVVVVIVFLVGAEYFLCIIMKNPTVITCHFPNKQSYILYFDYCVYSDVKKM